MVRVNQQHDKADKTKKDRQYVQTNHTANTNHIQSEQVNRTPYDLRNKGYAYSMRNIHRIQYVNVWATNHSGDRHLGDTTWMSG